MFSKLSTTLLFTLHFLPMPTKLGYLIVFAAFFSNMSAKKSSVNNITTVFSFMPAITHHLQLRKLIGIERWCLQYFCNELSGKCHNYTINTIVLTFCTYRCQRISEPKCWELPQPSSTIARGDRWKISTGFGLPDPSNPLSSTLRHVGDCDGLQIRGPERQQTGDMQQDHNPFKLSVCFFSARTFGCAWCMAMPC